MGFETFIEWCHHTWNGWRGCDKVLDPDGGPSGCDFCYAEAGSGRNPAVLGTWGPDAARVVGKEAYWQLPLKWDRAAEEAGERRRVFSLSLGDWLEDRRDLAFPRMRMLDLVRRTPHLDWLLLTKRPENFDAAIRHALAIVPGVCDEFDETIGWLCDWLMGQAPANVWLGVSVENQKRADERIPVLLQVPAAVRFLSCEPLLGPVDLTQVRHSLGTESFMVASVLKGDDGFGLNRPRNRIDWVIAGGESGPHARPMHPDWARSIRDQCRAAGVPFFFKQWGEWKPGRSTWDPVKPLEKAGWIEPDGCHSEWDKPQAKTPYWVCRREGLISLGKSAPAGSVFMTQVGKKIAGRLLDGREWSEFPRVRVGEALHVE